MMKRTVSSLFIWFILGMMTCLMAGCALGKGTSRFQVETEEVRVTIPGMEGEKTFLYLSDLHLILESDQIAAKDLEEVRSRMAWSSHDGVTAADSWPGWVECLNGRKADAILFGADMIDFASRANVDCLKEGLKKLEHPWLYVRADHDLAPSYLDGVFETESIGYQRKIGETLKEDAFADVMVLEFEDLIVAGWNNSTAQLTEAGLLQMKSLFKTGKPIILLTHVPIKPLGDDSLSEASKEAWGGRELLWGLPGTDCAYQANETTSEFLRMIYDENTPVCEILCGHLHFTWDGQVTEKVHQHVFGAALDRQYGVIRVTGK